MAWRDHRSRIGRKRDGPDHQGDASALLPHLSIQRLAVAFEASDVVGHLEKAATGILVGVEALEAVLMIRRDGIPSHGQPA